MGLVSVRRGLADRGGGPADGGAGLATAPQTAPLHISHRQVHPARPLPHTRRHRLRVHPGPRIVFTLARASSVLARSLNVLAAHTSMCNMYMLWPVP
jgi:hypothetical protein